MEFQGLDGKPVILRGMHSYPPQAVSAHRMETDLRHGDVEWAVELWISELRTKTQVKHLDILALLEKHHGVFRDVPPGRSPDRGFEHTIELEDGMNAVIATPYRHPKTYKDKIEQAIQELLRLGQLESICFFRGVGEEERWDIVHVHRLLGSQ